MLKHSLFVRLEAKPGKADDVAAFLAQGLQLANQEATTPVWFALRFGPTTFGVFDAFENEAGREARLLLLGIIDQNCGVPVLRRRSRRNTRAFVELNLRGIAAVYPSSRRPFQQSVDLSRPIRRLR